MIRKIKDWLIKKLGGYTAAEYNFVNSRPQHWITHRIENGGVVTIVKRGVYY